ncbi:MAG: DUF4340 domain-containing protein [Gammaproteobacteria bacterium]|nr:DUF4340 domain-containing protein [Gammaproteobacteria bacterium]
MKSRLLLNLVLVCVVAALALVAVFEPGKDKPKSSPLTSLDESGVESFTLRNPDVIEFERRNGVWWLKAPFTAPANEIRVRQLLDIARSETDAQYPVSLNDLSKFELDKPKVSMTLGDTTILFGGSDPIDMRRYVLVGSTLYLVRDDFYHHLSAKPVDYVDKKLLPEGAKLTSIAIPGLKATLDEGGRWQLEPPVADAPAVSTALLNAWQSARAIDVQRSEQPEAGAPIRIGLADGTAIEFTLVKREPELVVARKDWGLKYELVGAIAKQLLNEKVPDEPAKDTDDDEAAGLPDEDGHEHDETDENGAPELSGPEATEAEDGEDTGEEPMD